MVQSRVDNTFIDDVDRRAVLGSDGDDVLNESNRVDAVDIDGGAGNDQITGTSVGDVSDVLRGGSGNDTFFGLAGDDFIIPGTGDDLRVVGGAGSDTFFPGTNGGNDVFPEFSLEDQIDGRLLDGVDEISVSRLGNGRTLLEFVGANTTVQISGGVSPEQFVQSANDLLVNFPAGIEVRVTGADIVNVTDGTANDVMIVNDDAAVVDDSVVDTGGANNDGGDAPATPAAVFSRVPNGQGGFDVTGTNAGDPAAFGENGDDTIVTFGGDDAAVGFDGNDFINVGDGNDRAFGSGDDDVVIGGAGDDILRGDNEAAGNGADIIVGGTGNDLLKGDGNGLVGADRFVFAAGDGSDVIEDFQTGVDTLDFSAFGDADIALSQQGSDALVSIGDVDVTLRGVNADDLNADDFDGGSLGIA